MIDKVLVVAALIQTALTTLRASSRVYHIFRTGSIGAMEGPLILPPQQFNESAFLWELSTAFRHAVMLEACPEIYETEYMETVLAEPNENEQADEYRLSTFGVSRQQMEKDKLDAYIEELLLEDEESGSSATRTDSDSDYLDNLLDAVTASKRKKTDKRDDEDLSLIKIENEIANDLSNLKAESAGMLSKLRQGLIRRWRRAVGDLDEMSDQDDNDDDIESATSFHTQVEIASEWTVHKEASVHAYAPEIFRDLRHFFGVSETEYLHSVLKSGPFVSFQSNSKGAARVGGVFFFTRDGTYLIKTIKRDEVGAFLKILMRYHKFMKRNGRRSLLTRFCGMYEIELPVHGGKTRRETFVVMNSVFPVEAAKFITERFDLKGSTLGRECSLEERISKGTNAVLKDLDLAREVTLLRSLRQSRGPKMPIGLHIGRGAKAAFMSQLRRDVKLLADCKLIDYSLLVGIVVETAKAPSIQDLVVSTFADGVDQQKQTNLVGKILTPIKVLLTPPVFLAKTAFVSAKRSATWPLPYYGSELCGIEAGRLSHIQGERLGRKALYYFGLIDFLQPFNWKKEIEWKWKALRYGEGFSCVPPDEYAQRFLDFIENHVT